MDPLSWGAAIAGVVAIIGTFLGWIEYTRGQRDRLAQAEVDELKDQLAHPHVESDPARRLYIGKPKDR